MTNCNCRIEETAFSADSDFGRILTVGCPVHGRPCPFCEIVAGRQQADLRVMDPDGVIFTPLNPVTPGHVLVVPHLHVQDFTSLPEVTVGVMRLAALYAKTQDCPMNLITSKGVEATQSVFHLHVHLVPRREGDGLHLPWTGQHKEKH